MLYSKTWFLADFKISDLHIQIKRFEVCYDELISTHLRLNLHLAHKTLLNILVYKFNNNNQEALLTVNQMNKSLDVKNFNVSKLRTIIKTLPQTLDKSHCLHHNYQDDRPGTATF